MAKKRVEIATSGGSRESYPVKARLTFRGKTYDLRNVVNYLNLFSAAGDIVRDVTKSKDTHIQPPIQLRYNRSVITNKADFDSIMSSVEENSLLIFDIIIDRGNPRARHFPALLEEDTPSVAMTEDDDVETLRGVEPVPMPLMGGSNRSRFDSFDGPVHLEAPFAEAGPEFSPPAVASATVKQQKQGGATKTPSPSLSGTKRQQAPELVSLPNSLSSAGIPSSQVASTDFSSVLTNPAVAEAVAVMLQSAALRPILDEAAGALTSVLIKHSAVVIREFALVVQASPELGAIFSDSAVRSLLATLTATAVRNEQAQSGHSDDSSNQEASVREDALSSSYVQPSPSGRADVNPERSYAGYHQVPLVTQAMSAAGASRDRSGHTSDSERHSRATSDFAPGESQHTIRPPARIAPNAELSATRGPLRPADMFAEQGRPTSHSGASDNSSATRSSNLQTQVHRLFRAKLIARDSPKEVVVSMSQAVPVTWRIQNTGTIDWPTDAVLVRASGRFLMNPASLSHAPIRPNDVATVTFTVRFDGSNVERGTLQLHSNQQNCYLSEELPITLISEAHLPRSPIQREASAPRLRTHEDLLDASAYAPEVSNYSRYAPNDQITFPVDGLSRPSYPQVQNRHSGLPPARFQEATNYPYNNPNMGYQHSIQSTHYGNQFTAADLNLQNPQTRSVVEQLASEYRVDGDVVLDILREEGTLDIERCRTKLAMIMGTRA